MFSIMCLIVKNSFVTQWWSLYTIETVSFCLQHNPTALFSINYYKFMKKSLRAKPINSLQFLNYITTIPTIYNETQMHISTNQSPYAYQLTYLTFQLSVLLYCRPHSQH